MKTHENILNEKESLQPKSKEHKFTTQKNNTIRNKLTPTTMKETTSTEK